LAFLLTLSGEEARAWITLAEGDKGKVELEARLMVWAVREGSEFPVPAGTPAQDESINDFMIRRVRLLLRAQTSSRLEVYLQLGQDNINSKISADETGLRVKDAYLNYKRAEPFQLMVGQFKVPFLRQNLQSGFNQLLVDRAVLPSLRPAREGTRDEGGMVWGNLGGFQYRAAVFDGSDQEDTNAGSSLRGSARLAYNWFTQETGAAYTGTTLGEKRVLQIAAQGDRQNDRFDSRDDTGFTAELRNYRALAFDIFYDEPFGGRWSFTFEGAYVDRRDNYQAPAVVTRHIDGYYAQAGLLLPGSAERFQLTGRYEDLDTERDPATTTVKNRTFGLNWYAAGHARKIQLDYTRRRENPVALDNDEIRLSMAATW